MNFSPNYALIEIHSVDRGSILYRSITTITNLRNDVLDHEKGWSSGLGYDELEENFFHVSLYETRAEAIDNFGEAKRLKYEERELRYAVKSLEESKALLAEALPKNNILLNSEMISFGKVIDELNAILEYYNRGTVSMEELGSRVDAPTSRTAFQVELSATLQELTHFSSRCATCRVEAIFDASIEFSSLAVPGTSLSSEYYIHEARSYMNGIDYDRKVEDNAWYIDQALCELSNSVDCINLLKSVSSFQESALSLVEKVIQEVRFRNVSVIEKYGRIAPICYWVYLTYSSSGDLLYIGKTSSLYHRFTAHSHSSAWFSKMDSMAAIPFRTEAEALRKEYLLIRELRPRYNIVHNSNR